MSSAHVITCTLASRTSFQAVSYSKGQQPYLGALRRSRRATVLLLKRQMTFSPFARSVITCHFRKLKTLRMFNRMIAQNIFTVSFSLSQIWLFVKSSLIDRPLQKPYRAYASAFLSSSILLVTTVSSVELCPVNELSHTGEDRRKCLITIP